MRFRVMQGWQLADVLVPANTIVDGAANDQWSERARGLPPPLDAVPLDREALEAQVAAYPEHRHLLRGGWS